WMHLLAPDDPSHIVQKTGGGAGFTTYIAISQARKTAVFLAATDGHREDGNFSLFKAANDLLLTMAGLPLLPPEPPKPVMKRARPRLRRSHAIPAKSATPHRKRRLHSRD
ncbi:MAG TPA: hypothetical protein VIM62_11570, partial [Acidobacteriaceae bacterium]